MKFKQFASGLHEVLGLAYREGWLYCTQRGEVTRMKDVNGDGRADVFETVNDGWGINGDYHEYAFGSKFDKEGNIWVVLCLTGSFSSDNEYCGWRARGGKPFALQRLVWTRQVPFEVHEMRAKPEGFELTFTEPVDLASAGSAASYTLETYTYIYQSSYGSPEVDRTKTATVSKDGLSVRLVVDGLQKGHVHELNLPGVLSAKVQPLVHPAAYYTLNSIPER